MQPLVSIGIPNYNYSHYIVYTLNSVAFQTYQSIELIIIDDHSTDNSIKVIDEWIEKYKGSMTIKFIKNNTNNGLTKVCNQILNAANGKYFQPLDADDLILPDKIAKEVALMEGSKSAALIYSNIGIIDEKGNEVFDDYLNKIGYDKNRMPHGNIFAKLFDFNFVPLPSVLIRTESAKFIGGFDESLRVQDYYLWLKLSEKFDVLFLNEKTALYREHPSSMSGSALTNPGYTESVLYLKYSYYRNSSKDIQKKIAKNIEDSSIYLYTMAYPYTGKWLKRNLLINPGFKSAIYFAAIVLRIPYSFFRRLKILLRLN